jgi:multidrug resistance efflux pump
MLNQSKYSIINRLDTKSLKAFELNHQFEPYKKTARIYLVLFLLMISLTFLPWTQNIQTSGSIITLEPDKRPQTIHSIIDGRIEKWYIREGDYVSKGDTILQISETKENFLDPDLVLRMRARLEAMYQSQKSIESRIQALENQKKALIETRKFKLEQAENKIAQGYLRIKIDSIKLIAADTTLSVATIQLQRFDDLYSKGLKSLTDVENKRVSARDAEAQKISLDNLLLNSKNELLNAKAERWAVENEFNDRIAKLESEIFAAINSKFDLISTIEQTRNSLTNFEIRAGMYFVLAPQNGYINRTEITGVGELIQQGQALVSILPENDKLASAFYIDAMDFPLVDIGNPVRIIFDGWPAIVFSGWPQASYGAFNGKVASIDQFTNQKGQYRILVIPDESEKIWPDALRIGSGARGILLLKNVPVWYEVWRQLNGFPPDFYVLNNS